MVNGCALASIMQVYVPDCINIVYASNIAGVYYCIQNNVTVTVPLAELWQHLQFLPWFYKTLPLYKLFTYLPTFSRYWLWRCRVRYVETWCVSGVASTALQTRWCANSSGTDAGDKRQKMRYAIRITAVTLVTDLVPFCWCAFETFCWIFHTAYIRFAKTSPFPLFCFDLRS